MLVDRNGFDGLALHIDVPDLDGQVVAREDVAPVVGEANVGDGGNDFGKEGTGGWIFLLLELCNNMLVLRL